MRVQGLVTRVTDEGSGERGKVNVPVLRQNQFGHEQMRKGSLIEVVANLKTGVRLLTDQSFHLK